MGLMVTEYVPTVTAFGVADDKRGPTAEPQRPQRSE